MDDTLAPVCINRALARRIDIRLPGKGNSNTRGARPVHCNHLDDSVDSDQQVVDEELSLCQRKVHNALTFDIMCRLSSICVVNIVARDLLHGNLAHEKTPTPLGPP